MNKHYGEIVENTVRKNGYNLTELARSLQVNRRTVYNWFDQKNLKSEFIYRIGVVIKYDFSVSCPELFHSSEFTCLFQHKQAPESTPVFESDNYWKDKYIILLEAYNNTLKSQSQVA